MKSNTNVRDLKSRLSRPRGVSVLFVVGINNYTKAIIRPRELE